MNNPIPQNIVIIGSSGHAKVVIDIVEKEGKYRIAGLIDADPSAGEKIPDYRFLGKEEDLPEIVKKLKIDAGLVTIGDNYTRYHVVQKIKRIYPDLHYISTIHPAASVAKDVTIGEGTVIMAGAVVNSSSRIGRFCILNTNSSLDHDSVMGDYSSLAPNAVTGGEVRIGDFSAVSIGATVLHQIEIGEHAVIGAGSTVTKNIGSYCVAVGTPARVIRKRKAGERYL